MSTGVGAGVGEDPTQDGSRWVPGSGSDFPDPTPRRAHQEGRGLSLRKGDWVCRYLARAKSEVPLIL